MAIYFEEFNTTGGRFIIRHVKGTDAEQEIEFAEQVSRETDFNTREPGEYSRSFPVEQESSALEDIAQSGDTLYLAAVTADGEIAALSMCSYVTGKAKMRHLGDVSVTVAKKFWHMGLGTKLLEIQMEWAKTNGVEVLTLTADTLNTRAVRLYLSLGFTVNGVLPRQVKLADSSYRDMYAMSKFL